MLQIYVYVITKNAINLLSFQFSVISASWQTAAFMHMENNIQSNI